MKLTCYVTSTSPWFLYAASVSLCFFFFASNGRVTVASPPSCPATAGWTGPARLLTSSLRQSLAIQCQIWWKPSGAHQSLRNSLTSLYCVEGTRKESPRKWLSKSLTCNTIFPRLNVSLERHFPWLGLRHKKVVERFNWIYILPTAKKFLKEIMSFIKLKMHVKFEFAFFVHY